MNRYTILYYTVLVGTVVTLGLLGCARQRQPLLVSQVVATPVGVPGTQASWHGATGLADLRPGPIVQFEESCARCHGPEGLFHGADAARLDPPTLRRMVIDMMKGPAQLEPTPAQVEAMIAYNLVLRGGQPFVNQPQHHRTRTFEEEFLAFLKRHSIAYDPKHVFG